MNCDVFFDKVSENFKYLLDDFEFKIVHASGSSLGGYCLIILGSASFQIRFFHERGSVQADLGGIDAEADWPQSSTDKGAWYPLRITVDIINEKALNSDKDISISGKRISKLTVDENLSELSECLEPVVNDVREMFSNPHDSQPLNELKAYLGIDNKR